MGDNKHENQESIYGPHERVAFGGFKRAYPSPPRTELQEPRVVEIVDNEPLGIVETMETLRSSVGLNEVTEHSLGWHSEAPRKGGLESGLRVADSMHLDVTILPQDGYDARNSDPKTCQPRIVKGLKDEGSGVNLINQRLVKELSLPPPAKSTIGVKTLNGTSMHSYGVQTLNFSITDSLDRTRYFLEAFLTVDMAKDLVLGMPFIKLANPDVDFRNETFRWRDTSAAALLTTVSRVSLLEPEVWAKEALEKGTNVYCMHMIYHDEVADYSHTHED